MLHSKFLSAHCQLHAMLKNVASPHCEGPSPVRIESCTAALYSTASSGLLGLFCSLALRTIRPWIAHGASGRASHKHRVARVLLIDASASQAFYTRPWKHWWGFLRHLARPPPIPQPNAGGGVPLGFVNGCTLLDSSQRVTTALCAMRSISPATGGPTVTASNQADATSYFSS